MTNSLLVEILELTDLNLHARSFYLPPLPLSTNSHFIGTTRAWAMNTCKIVT